jgi:PP-loop superfamily ATP-utilizing enzyme
MVILPGLSVLPGYIEKIIHNPDKEHIISNLKKIGFRYVSLDLEGYRTGSSNPEKIRLMNAKEVEKLLKDVKKGRQASKMRWKYLKIFHILILALQE